MILDAVQKVCSENTLIVKYGPSKSLTSSECKKECPFNTSINNVNVCIVHDVRPVDWKSEDIIKILIKRFGVLEGRVVCGDYDIRKDVVEDVNVVTKTFRRFSSDFAEAVKKGLGKK